MGADPVRGNGVVTATSLSMVAFVAIDDVVLCASLSGAANKPALVFVHSLGTDHRIWDGVVERLGADFRILRYDKLGQDRQSGGQGNSETDSGDIGGRGSN